MPGKFDKVLLYAVNLVMWFLALWFWKRRTSFVLKYVKNYSSKFREKQSNIAAHQCRQEEKKKKKTKQPQPQLITQKKY